MANLAAVDRLHVQSVAEHEGDLFFGAEVAEPVPGEESLAADDEVGAKRRDRFEEAFRIRRQVLVQDDSACGIENAQVHSSGMQIDAAVECMGLVMQAVDGLLWKVGRAVSPHRG